MIKTKRTISVISFALIFAMVLTMLGGALAVTQAEIDQLKQQQQDINNQKKALQGTIGDLKGKMEEAMNLKVALDEQNELTRQEIELINEQIDLYEGLVEQKGIELEEAIADETRQKEELRVRMRKMEESGNVSYISILFNATSFMDLLSRLDSIDMILKRDKDVEEAYIAAREHVEEVKAEYEATLADCEATKVELENKKAQLEQEIAEAEQVIKDLEEDIKAYEKQLDAFDAKAASLGNTINQKVAELEEQQRKAAEEAAAQGQPAPTVTTGTGTYIWPLPGGTSGNPPTSAYGWRDHPILGVKRFHYGEDLKATSGTSIMAADSGTVALATYDASGYGNYVVINHGGGRTTLYGHMSSIAVTVGQSVNQGDVIGYVGSTGLSTGPHLHWETRVNGSTVDPKSYFGL